jgi:hypothetical protein
VEEKKLDIKGILDKIEGSSKCICSPLDSCKGSGGVIFL